MPPHTEMWYVLKLLNTKVDAGGGGQHPHCVTLRSPFQPQKSLTPLILKLHIDHLREVTFTLKIKFNV